MGVESSCTCSKDYGEKNFTLTNNEIKGKPENPVVSKPKSKYYDDIYNNINFINSIYYSPTIHNNESKRWQNCVPQKGPNDIFYGRASNLSSNSNSIITNTNNNFNIKSSDNNILYLPPGDKYEGEVVNNKPNGKGIYYSITGEIKEGEFIDGRLNGKGKMTLNNGFFLEGNFVDDELDGFGKTININGEMYEGEFKKGIREGKGKLILSNEDRFEGNYLKGKLEGNGKFITKDGEKYEGEFINGIPNGKGHKKYKDGSEYEGNFKNGKENGYGIKKWKNGEIYEGEFIDGLKNGKGKHSFLDGQKYEGDFCEDHYNGNGIYIWPDGLKYIGEFKYDTIEGKGILTMPNGDQYEGFFMDGKYNGFGVESKIDGSKYEGQFRNDDYEGHGVKTFSNGEKYDGEFHKGNFHGKGTFYYLDGDRLEGSWNNGNKEGIFKKISKDGNEQIIEYKDNLEVKEEAPNEEKEKTFNEFTFIILTNFEAKKLTKEIAKEKILISFYDKENLSDQEFINTIKDNIASFLNCKNEESLNNIYDWLNYLLKTNNNDRNIMQNELLTILSNSKEYPKEQEIFLNKKVKKYLLPKKDIFFEKLDLCKNNKEYIPFYQLKKIIEEEKIELKEQYFVYLFYALKKFDDPEASLNDLKIELLIDILNDPNNDSKMDEESDLEISDEEYNQIIVEFQNKLLHYINSNHTNLRFILNGLIQVTNWGEDDNVIEVVLIRPFFERMKEIGIWANNELEIYCIFNRYKLSEKYEGINIYLLEEELKNLKLNYNKNSIFNGPIIMENIKEESEENSVDS